ncbi:MAG TPA: hypothetical protein PLY70_00370 [Saprospiraceae bacterium]|nr:hypothetical protein [Saprospiraceae bacterium]HPN68269.1 hypothetical protein [Saprospiraceae bacterium]
MRRLIEFIEKNATAKSKSFIRKMEIIKTEDQNQTKGDYNPKTARYKSLKDLDNLFSN